METSLYVAAAAQRSLQKQLITVANNIANSNTVGFRAENVDFKSLVSNAGAEPVHFPSVAGLRPSLLDGSKVETGNQLDIALSGKGWFGISTAAGIAYTRDGRLKTNAFGELQTLQGHAVLDSSEAPILIPAQSGLPKIHEDGRITLENRLIGNIGVFEVASDSFSGRYSNSAFLASRPGIPIAIGKDVKISQGFVEASNVNPIMEMASLIEITRSFESAATIVDRADKSIAKSINELAAT